jgi:hypothetical protein
MTTNEERITALEGIANKLREGDDLAARYDRLEKAQLRLSESFTNLCQEVVTRLEALEEHPADAGAIPENCPEVGETVRCISGYGMADLPQEGELYVVKALSHRDNVDSGWWIRLRDVEGWYEVERFGAVPAGTLKINQEALVDTLMGRPHDPLWDLLTEPRRFRQGDIVRILPFDEQTNTAEGYTEVVMEVRSPTSALVGALAEVMYDEGDSGTVFVEAPSSNPERSAALQSYRLHVGRLELVAATKAPGI